MLLCFVCCLLFVFCLLSTAPAAGGPGHGARQTGDYGGVECIDRGTWTPPSASHSVYFHLLISFFCVFVFFPLLFCSSIVSELESWRFCTVRLGLIEGQIEDGRLGRLVHCTHLIVALVRIVANKMWDIG